MPDRYVVATRRGGSSDGRTARDRIAGIPGIRVLGDFNPDRVVVEATHEAIKEVRRQFDRELMVERENLHYPVGR